jgi:hypothetical protein
MSSTGQGKLIPILSWEQLAKMPDLLTVRWPDRIISHREAMRIRFIPLNERQARRLADIFNTNASIPCYDSDLLRQLLRAGTGEQLLQILGTIPVAYQVKLKQTEDGVRNKLIVIPDPPSRTEIRNYELTRQQIKERRRAVADAVEAMALRRR